MGRNFGVNVPIGKKTRGFAAALAVAVLCAGCDDDGAAFKPPPPTTSASGKPIAKSPDRLPPGQLMEGPTTIFGFTFPRDLKVSRPAPSIARASGKVDFDALTEYVKARVSARFAELQGTSLVFENASIKGAEGGPFTVSVFSQDGKSWVEIQSEEKGPPLEGLSIEERWKRVGMTPDGKLIDPHGME